MKEVWNEVCDCGVYANVQGVMTEICSCSSVQQARDFVRENWVEGEGMYVEIINHDTGKILCYFEDDENDDGYVELPAETKNTIENAFNTLWKMWEDDTIWGEEK